MAEFITLGGSMVNLDRLAWLGIRTPDGDKHVVTAGVDAGGGALTTLNVREFKTQEAAERFLSHTAAAIRMKYGATSVVIGGDPVADAKLEAGKP